MMMLMMLIKVFILRFLLIWLFLLSSIDYEILFFTDIVDWITFPIALTGKETGVKR